jgi:hypothetical protein
MPTVGHDAAMFARAGIPSAVLLVRNANGSHNSDEALDRKDFADGVHVLGRAMHRLATRMKDAMSREVYEVYAIKYATREARAAPTSSAAIRTTRRCRWTTSSG